jgi:uncharacterized protein with HEPN domain
MSHRGPADLIGHMHEAAGQACGYVEGMALDVFLQDKRTQQAVIFNLMILGEAATRLLKEHGDFLANYPVVPWGSMKGMRNRLAHGYFDIDLPLVWRTVQSSLPALMTELPAIQAAAGAAGNAPPQ